jgi:hypothetical protein
MARRNFFGAGPVAQRVLSARCEGGQCLHAEFDICDILVRVDALDFGRGQEIGMSSADDAIVIRPHPADVLHPTAQSATSQ